MCIRDSYAVLQVRLPEESKEEAKAFDFSAIERLAEQHGSQVFFAGRVAGQVVLNKPKQNDSDAVDFLTNITIVIKSSTAKSVSDCLAAGQVESLLPSGAEYFAAQVKRTM